MLRVLRWLVDTADQRIERFLLQRQASDGGLTSVLAAVVVSLTVVLAALLKSATSPWGAIDLIVVPVILGCFFFRKHTLFVVGGTILLDFMVSWQSEVRSGEG